MQTYGIFIELLTDCALRAVAGFEANRSGAALLIGVMLAAAIFVLVWKKK